MSPRKVIAFCLSSMVCVIPHVLMLFVLPLLVVIEICWDLESRLNAWGGLENTRPGDADQSDWNPWMNTW